MKEKYNIEYTLKSVSPQVLWSYISTPHGLENWFADNVTLNGKEFTFHWDKTFQAALQIGCRTEVFIRFRWKEDEQEPNRPYFEFKINQLELTGDTILTITDFSEADELEESKELWNNQIEDLRRHLGI